MRRAYLLGLVFLVGCAGAAARRNVLLPAMAAAWAGISANVEAGLTAPPDLPEEVVRRYQAALRAMQEALDSGEPARVVAVDWLSLQSMAERGINWRLSIGDIGPGVAESLRGLLPLFDEAYRKLVAR